MGQIEDCDIFSSFVGIKIGTGGNPTLRRCKIHDNKSSAIDVNANGTGQIEDCFIHNNAGDGVEIYNGGNPTVRGCCIQNNARVAIHTRDNGKGKVEDCDLRNNKNGAWNIDSTSQINGNKI